MKILLWIAGLSLLAVGVYFGLIYLMAWFEVKALPKGETFICSKHGPIHKDSLITFVDTPYCPVCFHERLSSAETILNTTGRVQ